jgi:translation initiation factor IF-2
MLATQETEASQQSTLQSLINKLGTEDTTDLKLILKADGPTALEALKHAVENINTPDNVRVQHIHSDIGQFTESDLALAQASGALLIGFNVNVPGSLSKKAEQQKVTLKTFDIIYQLTEYLEDIAQGMLVIATEEVVVATLNVLGIFYRKGKEMVIGGKCTDGTITNGDKFRIIRDDKQIGTGAITSLQKETQSVKTVKE